MIYRIIAEKRTTMTIEGVEATSPEDAQAQVEERWEMTSLPREEWTVNEESDKTASLVVLDVEEE